MTDTGSSQRIITIDGPAGAGKTTIARRLAERLEWTYLDTGAMYRAVGLAVREAGLDPDDAPALAALMDRLEIVVSPDRDGNRVLLNDRDVTGEIRTPEVSRLASRASAHGAVRERLMEMQRAFGARGGLVAEGRDMGTVVFPGAGVKIFLQASMAERARRRALELREAGLPGDDAEVARDMARRDAGDASRSLAPLRPADDAVILDSTRLTVEEVLDGILGAAREKFPCWLKK